MADKNNSDFWFWNPKMELGFFKKIIKIFEKIKLKKRL